MKKSILTASGVLLGALSVVAVADVTLLVTVDKTKDVTVFEEIEKDKLVTVEVIGDFEAEGAAEVEALSNIENSGNTATSNSRARSTTMDGSATGNAGIIGINQDDGNMVNQGNVVSAALTESTTAFVDSQDEIDQLNTLNTSSDTDSSRATGMTGSVSDNSGVVGVNQNAGDMNNQTNDVGMAIGMGNTVALSESALGQVNTENTNLSEVRTAALNDITSSASNNSGVTGINQSSGQLNNQASAVNISATTSVTRIPALP